MANAGGKGFGGADTAPATARWLGPVHDGIDRWVGVVTPENTLSESNDALTEALASTSGAPAPFLCAERHARPRERFVCPCPEYLDEVRTPCAISRLAPAASVLFLGVQRQPQISGHHLALVKPLNPGGDMKAKLREILQLAEDLLHQSAHQDSPEAIAAGRPQFGLSAREWQIVRGLTGGSRLTDVADTLGISIHTARNHLKSVFRKLHVQSQNELMRVVLESRATEG